MPESNSILVEILDETRWDEITDAEGVEPVYFDIPRENSGLRLDHYLKLKLPHLSKAEIHEMLKEKVYYRDTAKDQILHPKKSKKIAFGDQIIVLRLIQEEPADIPTDYRIVFEDDVLLIADKPANLPVHPAGAYHHKTLLTLLKKDKQSEALFLVNRIDRETSGLVVLTKSSETAAIMAAVFANREVHKEYLAIVRGEMEKEAGVIDLPLNKDFRSEIRVKMAVDKENGYPSRTEYFVERRFNGYSLVRVIIRTGRQHQIRVHFAYIGYPVVGDKLYGYDRDYYLAFVKHQLAAEDLKRLELPRQALHSHKIGFKHPGGSQWCEFVSELPIDLKEFIEKCEK